MRWNRVRSEVSNRNRYRSAPPAQSRQLFRAAFAEAEGDRQRRFASYLADDMGHPVTGDAGVFAGLEHDGAVTQRRGPPRESRISAASMRYLRSAARPARMPQ